ncbi:MAG: N-acetylmuramoyl-L-alanine amidase family protein [Gemmatimonadaceae bacterium]
MIGAALLCLQLAAAAAGTTSLVSPLTVRIGDRAAEIPVATRSDVAVVRADVLALALEGSLSRIDRQRFRLQIGDVAIDFTDRVAFARRGEEVIPLAAAPFVADDRLFLPYQVVSELVPRLTPDLAYDRGARVLHRVDPAVAAVTAAAAAPSADSVAPPPPPAAAAAAAATPAPRPAVRATHVIIVDAGHGGPDRGMTGARVGGSRLVEKDVTLTVARRAAEELRRRGHKVIMTRTADTLIALGDRGRIANRANGDLFMSIHVNAANPNWKNASAARGFETYFLAEAKTEDARRVADMENASEQYETSVDVKKGNPLSFILNDMKQNEHLRESSNLAAIIQQRLARLHPGPNRGVKQAGFKVLVEAFMPAVLVELGFGSNPQEAAFLRSDAEQRKVAVALADAAEAYLTQYDRRNGAATP